MAGGRGRPGRSDSGEGRAGGEVGEGEKEDGLEANPSRAWPDLGVTGGGCSAMGRGSGGGCLMANEFQ